MPFNKYRQNCHMKMVGATLNVAGNAYSQAARPQLIFPCKDILALSEIQVQCSGGFKAEVITKAPGGLVTVRIRVPGSATNIAAHTHDILVAAGSGAGKALMWSTGADLNELAGAGGSILGSGKSSGVVASSLVNITNPITGGPELSTGVNPSIDIYGMAIGYN